MRSRVLLWLMAGLLGGALAACSDSGAGDTDLQEARVCPERVTRDARNQPRNALGQIRYCWPGEARCYCDSDNDCYAQAGYRPCTPNTSSVDAGRDAGAPVDTGNRIDTGNGPVDTGNRVDTGNGPVDTGNRVDVPVALDAGNPVRDAGFDSGAVSPDAGCVREPTTPDRNGDPRNADGHIRYCWPGELRCFCDRDNDCYAEAGYVPMCGAAPDAGARDTGNGPVDTGNRVDTGNGPVDTGNGPVDTGNGPVDAGGPPGVDTIAYSGSFAVRTGRFTATLTVAGLSRQVVLYVPTTRPTNPALVLAFHGTNGSGDVMLDESGAVTLANSQGVIVAAPTSRYMSRGDWDHATEETYWETYPNVSPTANADLMLTRAIIAEAQRRYNVDADRVYAIGHSNGAFFATLAAMTLSDRIAAFANSSGGLVQCNTTQSCRFEGTGSTCAQLRGQSGWCNCTGAEKPGPIATSGRRPPGYFAHGTQDPLVSVYYTCALEARMQSLGYTVSTVLRSGDGHVLPSRFATDAWGFLSRYRRQ
ncbi:MAG: hypothetical protein JNK72_23375 [Myxococcales bacterium]|nr:hypothetical protein [Myxococcales bacterium]